MRVCQCEGGSTQGNDALCAVCRLLPQAPRVTAHFHPESDVGRSRKAMGLPLAIEVQAGGDHYKDRAIQPFHFVRRNNIPHAEGECIYKLLRWREKGGIADLEKVIHTVQLIIEEEKSHGKTA